MNTILHAENLVKNYAGHCALDKVSVQIPENSIFGLLGPNGAGKTSLIRIITQITIPDSGNILYKGKKLDKDHAQRIGYLPEERGLYKKMNVEEIKEEYKEEIADEKKEKEELKKIINNLKNYINDLKNENNELKNHIKNLKEEIYFIKKMK